MGKILDYIVKKGEGNYLCYKTNYCCPVKVLQRK